MSFNNADTDKLYLIPVGRRESWILLTYALEREAVGARSPAESKPSEYGPNPRLVRHIYNRVVSLSFRRMLRSIYI